jgi:predicted DNA-binding transcriptional regulator AlpA
MRGRTEPIVPFAAKMFGVAAERVVGTREVAAALGVSRQRVGQLARDDRTFPRPGTVLSGPVWHRAGIEAWAATHRPNQSSGGRMHPVVGALLRDAERLSREHRHGYVSSEHLWLAMAESDAGSPVRRAFESLGVEASEMRAAVRFTRPPGEEERRSVRMTPAVQQELERADRRAREAGRQAVSEIDLAIVFLDWDDAETARDPVLYYFARRGLDRAELRRRLLALETDPTAVDTFETRDLPKPRPRRRKRRRPTWLPPLMPNPLGRDPWDRHPWGSVFATRQDGRMYKAEGAQWFFFRDADGYFVRAMDGRPIGYRWLLNKPLTGPRHGRGLRRFTRIGQGKMEVLPMPPADIAWWPDHRFVPEN